MRWQGWAVTVVYLVLIVSSTEPVRERACGSVLTAYVVLLTAPFIAVAAWKGERPVGWRWGGR